MKCGLFHAPKVGYKFLTRYRIYIAMAIGCFQRLELCDVLVTVSCQPLTLTKLPFGRPSNAFDFVADIKIYSAFIFAIH